MDIESIYPALEDFRILQTRRHAQTAVIHLEPGAATGEEPEDHPDSEQVVLLVEGELQAEVGEETSTMKPGDSLVIGAGVKHLLRNVGEATVIAFTVYAPPVYAPALPRH